MTHSNRHELDYESPRRYAENELTLLRTMQLTEAELAKIKLESEGISCFISGANTSVAHPFAFNDVRLMVPKVDVERAREILERPADTEMEGEYVDETWRCPKCHRKSIQLLPASGLRLLAWYSWWGSIGLFVLSEVLSQLASGDRQFARAFEELPRILRLVCLVVFPLTSLYLILDQRDRACTYCGWKSTDVE